MITIGSLFDGISGFPLAGERLGMKAVWASEIEPFPLKVSAIRYPDMKQVGDITKININDLKIVDIVTGGSPCQDLSVAGKRAGLAGARSGLFMEQIRIVKELRDKDAKSGRPNGLIRPRFMVWENVPGAFSSNKGEDFRAVLEETAKIADETVVIPKPPKGKWNTFGAIMGNGWSIAWRVLDAQYWGVPQRRRRIFLVADFGGQSAPEVLFKREGLSRHLAESGEAREGITADVERSTAKASGADIYNFNMTGDKACTLNASSGSSSNHAGPAVIQFKKVYGICSDASNSMKSSNPHSGIYEATTSRTLDLNGGSPACNQGGMATVQSILPFDTTQITSPQNGNKPNYGDPCHPLCANAHVPAIVKKTYGADLSQKAEGICFKEEIATCVNTGTHGGHGNNIITYQKVTGPLMANSHPGSYTGQDAYSDMLVMHGYPEPFNPISAQPQMRHRLDMDNIVVAGIDCRNGNENGDLCGTLQAKPNGGFSYNCIHPVRIGYSVRRLTPLECERLQDYPDGWTDINWVEEKVKKNGKISRRSFTATDSAKYKALGNSVAVCCPEYVLEGIKEVLER